MTHKMPAMYGTIVVGTDGSETAQEAVSQAAELAKTVGATVLLVSAYEPVSETRLRHERTEVPEDVSWMVNPREDVQAVLDVEAGRTEVACRLLEPRLDRLRLRVLADHARGDDQRGDGRDVWGGHRRALPVGRQAEGVHVVGEGHLEDVAAALVRLAVGHVVR